MKRLIVGAVLSVVLLGCGVTEETKQFVFAIHRYQVQQEVVVKKLLNGVRPTHEEEVKIVKDTEALTRSTEILMNILGRPKGEEE